MTLRDFEIAAAKEARRGLHLPTGWWGDWRRIYAPNGITVKFMPSSKLWAVRDAEGVIVSRHDDRHRALLKARRL